MAAVVLDSGVLLARVLKETLTPQAAAALRQFQSQRTELHAPTLMRYEILSVVRKAVYLRRATPEEASVAMDTAFSYPVTLHFDDALLRRGFELAGVLAQPRAYDTQYLALAERLQCEFWTTDERLFNSARSAFPLIRWLGNVDING